MQPPDSRQRWVPFAEAQRILNLTETTLRREIAAGRITGEQRRRNPDSPTDQRLVWEVLVTDPPAEDAASESERPPAIRQEAPPATIDVLVGDLTTTHERLFEAYREIADLRERVGRAESDANHAQAHAEDLQAQLAESNRLREIAEATARVARERPWWRWWW